MSYRDGAEEGLTFAFRFTDASMSISNQGMPEIFYIFASFSSQGLHYFNGSVLFISSGHADI